MTEAGLLPIDEVARRLGLRASAIRYYEERGLITATSRHSGRRWYGPAEIRRLAIIRYWQQSGLMSLSEIADILAGPEHSQRWNQILADRIEALGAQIDRMAAAREYLEHILLHHHAAPDGCPHYEALIWLPLPGGAAHPHGAAARHVDGAAAPPPGGTAECPDGR
jgi:MerR family copper efflux transcriptional regulator